jgi:uncharacterized protein (TIGR02688 family)
VLRSVGLEPAKLTPRLKLHFIARLAPLVEPNFNFIELGPRGTGKSYFFSEFSPYASLVSGGQATKATLFYNNARRRVGLIGFWDTVAFDELGSITISRGTEWKDASGSAVACNCLECSRTKERTPVSLHRFPCESVETWEPADAPKWACGLCGWLA